MPGCSASAGSMTGSTELGPIQPQQDSTPLLLDERLFADDLRPASKPQPAISRLLPPATPIARRKMMAATHSGVQLTPLWEYVVRTKKFPKDTDVGAVFAEISERLRDPEWEVRQHALRVLVDVLPTFGAEGIDRAADYVLPDLVENLGNPAPAVRKGSLDAIRIYLLHSPRRDEITRKILHDGMNRADVLDDYQTNVTTGVILATPLLLFPSRSGAPATNTVVREATQALAMRLVQVSHQESALRSLARIRETVGEHEFDRYLAEVDDSMRRNFELLCEVYGVEIKRSSSSARRRRRPRSKAGSGAKGSRRRRDSVEDSIKEVVPVDKSWDSEDSDTSGIAEEDEENARVSSSASVSSSARVVLETEIKFDEETAITMTILEEQDNNEKLEDGKVEIKEIDYPTENNKADVETTEEDTLPEEQRRKTPKRVHFGGEIVKLRTPDSEDAESMMSQSQLASPSRQQNQLAAPVVLPRTRIPLPVYPATRMPRRPRSSSQPNAVSRGRLLQMERLRMQRRSASSSPRRELHTHRPDLSPKKSILARSAENQRLVSPSDAQLTIYRPAHVSRRDSISPRIVIEEIDDNTETDKAPEEPSFRICEESSVNSSPRIEISSSSGVKSRSPSPALLGDVCSTEEEKTIESVFGDRSGASFQEKMRKDHENMMRAVYRSRSAPEQFAVDWDDKGEGRDRRRSQSAKSGGFEVFPRQERNYILMELASPVKDRSRRTSLEDEGATTIPELAKNEAPEKNDSAKENEEKDKDETRTSEESNKVDEKEETVDSNKLVESETKEAESDNKVSSVVGLSNEVDAQLGIIDVDMEKSALDAKERSSDSSSDGEWKQKEPSWEELGLVDDEVLKDFHNKEDWKARVRGLERIASALRTPSTLTTLEPRLGSLLLAVLGGERSCRVAAAGLAVARVVLAGVSEEALKNRLPLIAWGLARQGGPNAAQLARLTMLRVGAGLFLEKLLQPQCTGARNAKTRENTLQLFIFSLVTFPSTELKVKSAVDKVVAMVGDRRKRVRHSALDTLAILSQIYDSEDILEASKRYLKGKSDGQTILAAIKTRLSRKLLPNVSADGLVVYGLQVSSNAQNTGADVEWIIAGSGSVSPGTGRTRSQLLAMSRTDDDPNEQSNVAMKPKIRPSSERNMSSGMSSGLLEKDERISSWKLLPQSDDNDKPRRKIDRTSKSADTSKANNSIFESQRDETLERESKIQKPYATPKRAEREFRSQIPSNKQSDNQTEGSPARGNSNAPQPKQESRIPIYTGVKAVSSESIKENYEKSLLEDNPRLGANGHLSMHQRRKLNAVKSAAPRSNYTINYAYPNRYVDQQHERSYEDVSADLQKFKEDYRNYGLRGIKENQRVMSHEKLNKGFDDVVKNSRSPKSTPYYQYASKTETYETIYQRQRRLKENRETRPYTSTAGIPFYGYAYEGYVANPKYLVEGVKNSKKGQVSASPQKRTIFSSPFDDSPFDQSTETTDKDNGDHEANGNPARLLNGSGGGGSSSGKSATTVIQACDRTSSSPRHDGGEARSSSGSSASSNRSLSSAGQRARGSRRASLPAHTESDESNNDAAADQLDRASPAAAAAAGDKAFNVISAKSSRRNDSPDVLSMRADLEKELDRESSDSENEAPVISLRRRRSSSASANSSSERLSDRAGQFGRSRSALSIDKVPPIKRRLSSKHSLESLLRGGGGGANGPIAATIREEIRLPPLQCNGYGDQSPSAKSSAGSRSSSDQAFSARCSSRSITELNEINDHDEDDKERSVSPFETLDFRNGGSATAVKSAVVSASSVSRPKYDCDDDDDDDLRNTDSNNTLYSCNSVMSPKSSSPKRFVSEDPPAVIKDTDSDETLPVPIGFSNNHLHRRHLHLHHHHHQQQQQQLVDSCSDDGSESSHDDELAVNKSQISRLPTPVDLPKRLCKLSPCRMRPAANCHRATVALTTNRHYEKPEKLSKQVQQCFANLDSSAWEITLKGLRTLAQIARDEPELLDACPPGLLARMLGKHVKNLRSQVARVACATTSDVFGAHIRSIDQDLDEVAGPLLHRTADTNRFLREDCNVALDSMIEHFPPHRTIMTIANRGANHQNTIVHATTARLLYSIVSEIGADCAMVLAREVRDKLFLTMAKLLTDGNLQTRKHAKETFRLLLPCEGFRKALTDAVPETTLRLIDKTLRSL